MADFGAMTAVGDLQWHWGSAYLIASPMPGIWLAQRRDTHQTLKAEDPEALRQLIYQDYFKHPVPRPAVPALTADR